MPALRLLLAACTAALAVAALLAGCGQAKTAPASSTGGFAAMARATATHEPLVRTEPLVLPADFPADVYLPGDYTVGSVLDVDGVRVVSVTADGRVPALFADARTAMAAQGWRQTLSMQHSGDDAMATFEKGARAAVLSFAAQPGGDVVLSVQLRPEGG